MVTRREFLETSLAIGAATAAGAGTSNIGPARKRILILGGTGFVGPHLVRSLLAGGHSVTVFNRGRSGAGLLGKDVEELHGDRNGNLDALKGRRWDAVVDESASNGATAPAWVKASAMLLKDAVEQYLYVSTRSVYAGHERVPMTADAPVLTLENSPLSQGQEMPYGHGKAYAEKEAFAAMPGRVTVVRPGLIVGPGDDTDRFTYWPARLSRGGEILAPGDGTDRVQIIDVRDLADFEATLIGNRTFGTFNGLGPDRGRPFKDFLGRIHEAVGGTGTYTWVPTEFLLANAVEPYSDLPAWRPARGRYLGFAQFDLTRELAAGLRLRALEDTAVDTLEWFRKRTAGSFAPLKAGMAPEREQELLALWSAQQPARSAPAR
jgi:2'-hydroxyisoflavone reductase